MGRLAERLRKLAGGDGLARGAGTYGVNLTVITSPSSIT